VFPGYVPRSELPAFYSAADAFVFPSLHEGFGLPILEAMKCGCPVVTGDNSSLPEVAGDAALCVDVGEPDALAGAMRRALEDAALREELVERGRLREKMFSWRASAGAVWELYRRLAA